MSAPLAWAWGELLRRDEEVLEGLDSAHAYSLVSLDAPTGEEDLTLHEQIGEEDETLELLEYRASLVPLLEQLPPRERMMLYLRFLVTIPKLRLCSTSRWVRLKARRYSSLRSTIIILP